MLQEKIQYLQDMALLEHLAFRLTFGEDGHGWAARFTSFHVHQPLCTGHHKTSLEAALDDLIGKAERSIAPHRARILAAIAQDAKDAARQLRRMGVR